MKLNSETLFFLFLGCAFSFSCSKTKSDLVDTKAWYSTYEMKLEGTTPVCTAKFQVGGDTAATFIELVDDDSVTCNGVTMIRADSLIGEVIYKAGVHANSSYSITLHRKNENDYVSIVALPEDIILRQPTNNQTLRKQEAFQVQWDPSSSTQDSMRINMSFTEATRDARESVSKYPSFTLQKDTGSFLIPATATPGAATAVSPASDVPASLTLTRIRNGTMATGLAGTFFASKSVKLDLLFH